MTAAALTATAQATLPQAGKVIAAALTAIVKVTLPRVGKVSAIVPNATEVSIMRVLQFPCYLQGTLLFQPALPL